MNAALVTVVPIPMFPKESILRKSPAPVAPLEIFNKSVFACLTTSRLTAFGVVVPIPTTSVVVDVNTFVPPSVQPLAPPLLDHIVARCLAKDPENRWQSARDISHALAMVSDATASRGHALTKRRTLVVASLVGVFFAFLTQDTSRGRRRVFLKIFGGMIVGALALAWIMYPYPIQGAR